MSVNIWSKANQELNNMAGTDKKALDEINEQVSELKEDLSGLSVESGLMTHYVYNDEAVNYKCIDSGYMNELGEFKTSASIFSRRIEVTPFSKISSTSGQTSANAPWIVVFNSKDEVVFSEKITGKSEREHICEKDASYVYISDYNKNTMYSYLKAAKEYQLDYMPLAYKRLLGENPLDVLLESGGYATCFEKIMCIGDSLTAGNCNYNGASSGEYVASYQSYPNMLERMLGNTVINQGFGGAVATTSASAVNNSWYKRAIANNWFDEKAQAYIIALGTNDIGYYTTFDGDVDTDIKTDFTQNANTSVGGYAKIIQHILSIQPKAVIFCVTIPTSRNDLATRTTANTKIRAIAEKFGCHVIDLEVYRTISSTDFKEKYYNGGHLNALGYHYLAREINTFINYIIDNNTEKFQDIQFIGTEYSYTD